MPTRDQWLARLARLNGDRSRGPAPHKPLLLLAELTRLDEGEALPAVLMLTPELAFRFQTLWTVVAHRRTQRPDVRLPFHHLQSDGVWSPLAADGTPSPHARLTRAVVIDPDFAGFVTDPTNRADAKRFRLRVVAAYEYTCALTGYRLTTVDGAAIVDAAHIHRFAESGNNDPRNGLALCKNAHWMFDEGLWTLAGDLTVEVAAAAFAEAGPDGLRLVPYHGRRLTHLPRDPAGWPDPAHLDWHRRNVFAAG